MGCDRRPAWLPASSGHWYGRRSAVTAHQPAHLAVHLLHSCVYLPTMMMMISGNSDTCSWRTQPFLSPLRVSWPGLPVLCPFWLSQSSSSKRTPYCSAQIVVSNILSSSQASRKDLTSSSNHWPCLVGVWESESSLNRIRQSSLTAHRCIQPQLPRTDDHCTPGNPQRSMSCLDRCPSSLSNPFI